jgi:two-component system nitrate/nitrite sensor histidine kinase NarX
VAQSLLSVFAAQRVVIAAKERKSSRLRMWSADAAPDQTAPPFAPTAPIVVAFDFACEWECQLAIVGAQLRRSRAQLERLADRIVDELTPAVHNVFEVHRLQTRAAAIERAHLARVLHDGVIQSLISAEMQVNAARRRLSDASAGTIAELLRIETILRHEVLGIRDLMQRIKPMQVEPGDLCAVLAEQVEKFKAETGTSAAFFADVRSVKLTPATCAELVRIVQEALSNIRKHSGAAHALVRLHEAHGSWRLVIEDDGCGFDAGGDVQRSPVVIRECVRSLGGDLAIRQGSRGGLLLDITFTS